MSVGGPPVPLRIAVMNTIEQLRLALGRQQGEPRTRRQRILNCAQHVHLSVGKLLEVQAEWDHPDREAFDTAVALLEEVGRWRRWGATEGPACLGDEQ